MANFFTLSTTYKLTKFSFSYLQMLLPCDQPYIRALTTQRTTYSVGASEFLPYDVERLLVSLLHKELKLAKE